MVKNYRFSDRRGGDDLRDENPEESPDTSRQAVEMQISQARAWL